MRSWWENNSIKLVLFLIYEIISVCYLIKLNHLNTELKGKTYLDIAINSSAPLYLLGSIVLLGVGLLYLFFLYRNLWQAAAKDYLLLTVVILAILTIINMILIIYMIQNPILRAILSVYIIGGAAIYAFNN